MRLITGLLVTLSLLIAGAGLRAQSLEWIQIEARPSEGEAVDRAIDYAGRLPNVSSFSLPSGWFAIVLGPYDPVTVDEELARLRAFGEIPGDSFVSDGTGFGRRVFGEDILSPATPAAAPAPLQAAEETPAQSRAAEALLTREERAEVQEALQWDGFYNSTIDAAFGPGTRRAMSDWQAASGYEPTGVLSTAQRAELLDGYRAELAALGLTTVIDTRAGIEIDLPTGQVDFDRYDAPFAHFEPREPGGPKVLLISQSGDRDTLRSLYEVIQTLEIVPLDGARRLDGSSFQISGANGQVRTSVYAELNDGAIKGYGLIWPADADPRQRDRVLQAMRGSFRSRDGVLPDTATPVDAERRRDLLAGLDIRTPERSRSGFYIDAQGRVLTTAEAVVGCGRITVDGDLEMRAGPLSEALGLAVLEPETRIAPLGFARFRPVLPRRDAEISVAGYSYGGALIAPTLTFGVLAEPTGLNGEDDLARLTLAATDSDAGGPVFDAGGAVVGALLGTVTGENRQLPADVRFASASASILAFLGEAGVIPAIDATDGVMAPEDLTVVAGDMTVLVECWN